MWLKVLYLIRINRFTGPLLTIIAHMAHTVLRFCMLLGLLILVFAFTGMVLFEVPQFATF